MPNITFSDTAIVACGTLSLELNHLKKTGFLDTRHLFFTTPGLHEDIPRLERHLVQQIACARDYADKVIVVYGGKFCYVNVDDPTRTMQTILAEQGPGIAKIEATHCMDMIASEEQRDEIALQVAGGQRVWWMTPGWIQFRHKVFKDWDRAMANENFPRHNGGAVVLDGIGFTDEYMEKQPEAFLDYADWMGIPIQPVPVSLDRFKSLLTGAARKLSDRL
jgi:hypothetical protein